MKRLNYLDGLKGWCAAAVCILHFWLMYDLSGFVGWRCLPEAVQNPYEYFFEWFPLSLLVNSTFPLYLFFAILSFVSCYLFLKNPDEGKLKRNILMRYFRFLPIVAISCFAAYLLLTFGLCPLQEYYDLTGNTWGYARLEETYSFFDMLKIGFFTAFFQGTQLVSPLWCLHYIYLGSIMTFLVMLLYNNVKNKMFFFSFLLVLLFFVDQIYLSFVSGIFVAVLVHKGYTMKKATGVLFVLVGSVLGVFPPVLLPGWINIATVYAIGAFFVLMGIHCTFSNHPLLCNRFMEFLGKESLSIIIWQMLVLQSLNIILYHSFHGMGIEKPVNIAINFLVNTGVSLLLTWVSSKTITPWTNALCRKVSALVWE